MRQIISSLRTGVERRFSVRLSGPGIPQDQRVEATVSHYDLLPTILDLEHLSVPAWADGASLVPVLTGRASRIHEYVYGEETALTPQYSVRNGRYKLIESIRDGHIQCFDTVSDPQESKSICADVPLQAAELKQELDQHIQQMIRQAHSYADWRNNLALAVLEQRDSKALLILAPDEIIVAPSQSASFQLSDNGWKLYDNAQECSTFCYWSPAGPGSASVEWRSDTPMIGEYDISIRTVKAPAEVHLATNANLTVRFKGGTLSFPVDENDSMKDWVSLGRFHDPISVTLTNMANRTVAVGTVRFQRVAPNQHQAGEGSVRTSSKPR